MVCAFRANASCVQMEGVRVLEVGAVMRRTGLVQVADGREDRATAANEAPKRRDSKRKGCLKVQMKNDHVGLQGRG